MSAVCLSPCAPDVAPLRKRRARFSETQSSLRTQRLGGVHEPLHGSRRRARARGVVQRALLVVVQKRQRAYFFFWPRRLRPRAPARGAGPPPRRAARPRRRGAAASRRARARAGKRAAFQQNQGGGFRAGAAAEVRRTFSRGFVFFFSENAFFFLVKTPSRAGLPPRASRHPSTGTPRRRSAIAIPGASSRAARYRRETPAETDPSSDPVSSNEAEASSLPSPSLVGIRPGIRPEIRPRSARRSAATRDTNVPRLTFPAKDAGASAPVRNSPCAPAASAPAPAARVAAYTPRQTRAATMESPPSSANRDARVIACGGTPSSRDHAA